MANREEADHLKSLGVILDESDYDEENFEFRNCLVSEETLIKLDLFWGHYCWGLTHSEEEVNMN